MNSNTIVSCLLLIQLMICIGCNPKKENVAAGTEATEYIVVKDVFNNVSSEFLLSEIASDIEIIPLKFDAANVFDRIDKIRVDGDDLFISSGLSKVFRYNRKGEFLNKIGAFGEGPEEYSYCFGLSIDTVSKKVFVASGFCAQNQIKSYSYSGNFIDSKTVAPKGYCMLGSEGNFYDYRQNMHIFRRMLPLTDGGKDLWLLQMQDTSANVLATFYNTVDLEYMDEINENGFDWDNFNTRFWTERSPVCSIYGDEINFVFEGNDTIYRYDSKNRKLDCRYILDTGVKHDIRSERKAVKSYEDCLYPRVADMFETPENIYISLEKDKSCYLIRYGKKEGNVEAIESKGDIRSGGINNTHFRAVYPPALKNDLCGGLPFYPDFCDDERWIKVYSPEDLLEQIDIETLKNEQVLMPEKKKELLNLLQSLKSDDNPVVVIATLK